jgi:tripartite-type tricarboxylate transporter receptor subunit TctC
VSAPLPRLETEGAEGAQMSPAEFARFLDAKRANWMPVVKEAEIRLE